MATSQQSPSNSIHSQFLYQKSDFNEGCILHNNQQITNFCASLHCLKSLCPSCISQHYQYHHTINQKPDIQSFQSLRNKCMKKVLTILQSIKDQGNLIDVIDNDSIYNQAIKTIQEVKINLINTVKHFFQQLQMETLATIKKNKQNKNWVFNEFEKVNKITHQLKTLSSKLDIFQNQSFLQYAKHVIRLDPSKIMESVRSSYKYATGIIDNQKKNLYLMRNYDKKVIKMLSNIISYGQNKSKQLNDSDLKRSYTKFSNTNSKELISKNIQDFIQPKQVKGSPTVSNQNISNQFPLKKRNYKVNYTYTPYQDQNKLISPHYKKRNQNNLINQLNANIEETRSVDENKKFLKTSDHSVQGAKSSNQLRVMDKLFKKQSVLKNKVMSPHSPKHFQHINNYSPNKWKVQLSQNSRNSLHQYSKNNPVLQQNQWNIQNYKKNLKLISNPNKNFYQQVTQRKQHNKLFKSQFKRKKQISMKNFFNKSCEFKYLHFFQNDENIVHFFDIEENQSFVKFQVKSDRRIPQFHKSISVLNGNLFLIGGTYHENNKKSDQIMLYDFRTQQLKSVTKMFYGRSSHSICLGGNNRYIYILGGITNEQSVTASCQRFDVQKFRVQEIKPLNTAGCSFASCTFNERYICKFGGVSQNLSLMHNIEIYDSKYGNWKTIQPQLPQSILKLLKISTATAVQINQSQIMIMGGYNDKNEGQKNTYFLKIQPPKKCQIIDINTFTLPYGQGFWCSCPIIHNNKVFALQNITNYEDGDQCLQNLRRILVFDGNNWTSLN